MKKRIAKRITLLSAVLLICLLSFTGCRPVRMVQGDIQSGNSDFNFIFRYGVGAKNVLNTFQGTYTKDMVMDPLITTQLALTEEEMGRVRQKMTEIDFFNYPEIFAVDPRISGNIVEAEVTPYSSFYFKVQNGAQTKELQWDNKYIMTEDVQAGKLKDLIRLVIGIIQSKPEYQALPPPRSGYM